MTPKRKIAISGIALLAGLALLENATRTVEVLPATVVDVKFRMPYNGDDDWTLIFALADGSEHHLEPTVRSSLQTGDVFCVRMHRRSWAAPKFQKAADKTC